MLRPRASTGIEGLDSLIGGGLRQSKVYLVSGEAGTGKTIFCLQYVLAGMPRGEHAVYVPIKDNLKCTTPVSSGIPTLTSSRIGRSLKPYDTGIKYGGVRGYRT